MTFGKPQGDVWRFGEHTVPLDRYPARGAKKHAIVLHGPWDHAALLSPIAQAFQAAGVSTVVVDLPGCGRSADQSVAEYSAWVDLVVALCAGEREATVKGEARQLVLVGIGLGGMLGYFAASKGALVDWLFVTALADPRQRALRSRLLGNDLPSRLTPLGLHWLAMLGSARRFVPAKVSARVLCNDETLQAQLEVDPQCAPEHTVRFVSSIFATAPAIEPEAFRACPVVLVAPTADRFLALEPSLDFFRRLPGDKQLHLLKDAGHLPIDNASASLLAEALITLT